MTARLVLDPSVRELVTKVRGDAWQQLTPAFRGLLARKAGVTLVPTASLDQVHPDDAVRMQAALAEFLRQAEAARRCLGWAARASKVAA